MEPADACVVGDPTCPLDFGLQAVAGRRDGAAGVHLEAFNLGVRVVAELRQPAPAKWQLVASEPVSDETASNRLSAAFEATNRAWDAVPYLADPKPWLDGSRVDQTSG